MLWIILALTILNSALILGLLGIVSELTPPKPKRPTGSFLDDDWPMERDYEDMPVPKGQRTKQAVKKTTSLKNIK